MISRLQLNLRPSGSRIPNGTQSTRTEPFIAKTNQTSASALFTSVDFTQDTRSTAVGFFTVGNLGEQLDSFLEEKSPEELCLEDFSGVRV